MPDAALIIASLVFACASVFCVLFGDWDHANGDDLWK